MLFGTGIMAGGVTDKLEMTFADLVEKNFIAAGGEMCVGSDYNTKLPIELTIKIV